MDAATNADAAAYTDANTKTRGSATALPAHLYMQMKMYEGPLHCKNMTTLDSLCTRGHDKSRSNNLVMSDPALGSAIQSIVNLTSSLRGQLVKCFMTL